MYYLRYMLSRALGHQIGFCTTAIVSMTVVGLVTVFCRHLPVVIVHVLDINNQQVRCMRAYQRGSHEQLFSASRPSFDKRCFEELRDERAFSRNTVISALVISLHRLDSGVCAMPSRADPVDARYQPREYERVEVDMPEVVCQLKRTFPRGL